MEIQVEQEQTVERILRRQIGLTKNQIRRLKFRPNGILKNGERCRVTQTAYPGDRIVLSFQEEQEGSKHLLPCPDDLWILYEDSDVIAVYKQPGVVTHPQGVHYQDTLANQVAAYYRRKEQTHSVRPVGRLDKETSGVVVFAKNQIAAARLQKQREEGIFQKKYLAVVHGNLQISDKEYKIEDAIGQDPENPLKMCLTDTGKNACTRYKVRKSTDRYSLLEVELDTGRTHQIRIHMAGQGCPLYGDQLYGVQDEEQRALLHAWKTWFLQPFTKEKIQIEAPVPEDIKKYW